MVVQAQFGLGQLEKASQAEEEPMASNRKTYGRLKQWHFQGPVQE